MTIPKCPHCSVKLIEDDTYDQSIDDTNNMIAVFHRIGHCPKCEKEYQWDVCYDLDNPLVTDLDEV